MADQAEVAFLRVYLNTLTSQPVIYKDDYQQPPENSLKKVPVLQISLPAPPRRSSAFASTSTSLTLTFKSLKPAASYTLAVHPTDSIQTVKERLAAQPNGPPVAAQRLLLKGKALADAKLVKEYPLADGDTVNLVLKAIPTASSDKDTPMPDATDAPNPTITVSVPGSRDLPPISAAQAAAHPRRHTRIPSVVLSPSPSHSSDGGSPAASTTDITLTLDDAGPDAGLPTEEISAYHVALAEPAFWQKLLTFLNESFPSPADAARAWEDFLRASKNTLTASEVARIRDRVGVSGMAGT
ncbi:Ubiquitin-like protein [Mycena venus]|uniref:Ubiquitin-like protein n=1 Tax=Mycena venus TaxID=2733690 RepID=A0A8H6YLV3_9AGAR|nr:Ubiquitin-like protein [Mycena venus]